MAFKRGGGTAKRRAFLSVEAEQGIAVVMKDSHFLRFPIIIRRDGGGEENSWNEAERERENCEAQILTVSRRGKKDEFPTEQYLPLLASSSVIGLGVVTKGASFVACRHC